MNTVVIILATIGGMCILAAAGYVSLCAFSDWCASRHSRAFNEGSAWQRERFGLHAHWFSTHKPTEDLIVALSEDNALQIARDEWWQHMKDYDPNCNSYHPKERR